MDSFAYSLLKLQYTEFLQAYQNTLRGEPFKDTETLVYDLFDRFGMFASLKKADRLAYLEKAMVDILVLAKKETGLTKRAKLLALANESMADSGKPTKKFAAIAKRLIVQDRLNKENQDGDIEDLKSFIIDRIEDLTGEIWD